MVIDSEVFLSLLRKVWTDFGSGLTSRISGLCKKDTEFLNCNHKVAAVWVCGTSKGLQSVLKALRLIYGLVNTPMSVHLVIHGFVCKHTQSCNCTVNN